MARSKETNISAEWTGPETLAESQLWEVKAGSVSIAFGAVGPDLDDGITMNAGDVIRIEAGEIVHYRRTSGQPAHLQREPKA